MSLDFVELGMGDSCYTSGMALHDSAGVLGRVTASVY